MSLDGRLLEGRLLEGTMHKHLYQHMDGFQQIVLCALAAVALSAAATGMLVAAFG